MNLSFYKNKVVLITGHTGFKGAWLCKILTYLGANVIGYALNPPTDPNLFTIASIEKDIISINGDIRDLGKIDEVLQQYKPEIVFHLAAQPIVRDSYTNPVYTYETNVMGTVNLLDSIRRCSSVKSVINVTTDKVYENKEWEWGYREIDNLNGFDPYSNSKSCAELVTSSFIKSFFSDRDIAISTCRAGNVIGGGDFANDRIIPDCIRAAIKNDLIVVRNPDSIRPYQHVIEPLVVYLLIAQEQYKDVTLNGSFNIGPDYKDCVKTGVLVDLFCKYWGDGQEWINKAEVNAVHEANFLKLDCSKLKKIFNWEPKLSINEAVNKTVEWSKCYLNNGEIARLMENQISEYLKKGD